MLTVDNISKIYADEFGFKNHLLSNVTFNLPIGKIFSILSPSGSGKSTLLKIIAGLETSTSGSVSSDEKICYIPSEPSSFPWLNVRDNILFAMKEKNNQLADLYAQSTGLDGYETHFPNNNSLGFRLRISLARALAHKPKIIIIDEAFSKMDSLTKEEIYSLILKIKKEYDLSFLIATSNIPEALFLSDSVFVMKKNPGEISESFNVEFKFPRDHNLFTTEEFTALRSRLENSIKKIDSQILHNITI